jgi:hypothetical protein
MPETSSKENMEEHLSRRPEREENVSWSGVYNV